MSSSASAMVLPNMRPGSPAGYCGKYLSSASHERTSTEIYVFRVERRGRTIEQYTKEPP